MSKILKMKRFFGQRSLLAMSLAAAFVAFGCTTDRTLGNGDLNDRSGVRMAPTGGVTSGSETAPTWLPPPMTSSYSRSEAMPRVRRTMQRLPADEAALIMVQQRPPVRVLGPVSPALSGNAYYSLGLVTGQWQNPAVTSYVGTAAPTRTATSMFPTTATPMNTSMTATRAPAASAPAPVRIVSNGRSVRVTNQAQ